MNKWRRMYYSLDDKEKVAWADALVEALRALRHFRETVAVQIEAIALIACLTDTGTPLPETVWCKSNFTFSN